MKAAAILTLTRPLNVLLTGAAVLLGIDLGRGDAHLPALIFGPLSAMLIAAFGNIDNDLADLPIDRINRPNRPLPSGAIAPHRALILSLAVLVLGLLAARLAGKLPLALAGAAAVLLLGYNRWGKRQTLIGNLMVAFAGGLPLVYAGLVVEPSPERWKYLWLGFALGAAFHLARELVKDIEDVEGDRQAGAKTVPLVLGEKLAGRIAGGYLLVVAILAVTPGILQWCNSIYLYGVMALLTIPSVFGCAQLWGEPSKTIAARWSIIIKMMMAAGLLLLWLGAK